MIVADTNVLSEPLRAAPDESVLDWLRRHRHELAITTVSVGELIYGVRRLPPGARRDRLTEAVDMLLNDAHDRVLGYDIASAVAAGDLRARRTSRGRTVGAEDTMIAGICLARGFALATRNVRDFDDTGLTVHDPWRRDGR